MKRILALTLCLTLIATLAAITPAFAENAIGSYPVIRLMQHRFTPEQCSAEAEIEEALNKIFREKCGCEVDIIFLSFGDVPDKLNLLLTGGKDSLDIFSSLTFSNTADMAAAGQVLDITPYMENELKETYEMYSKYPGVLDCTTVDGKIYGIPSMTAWSSPNIYAVKKSYADDAGVDMSKVTSMDELTTALIAMKEAHPEAYFIPASGAHQYFWPKGMDYLGDDSYLGVILNPDKNTKIENYYESELFLNHLANVKVWQEHEILLPDAASNGLDAAAFLGVQNGYTVGSTGYAQDLDEWLYETNYNHTYGDEEMVGCYLNERYLATGNVTTYQWHVTPFGEHPELACKVLNELFTNKEAAMLLVNGIEGEHYVINDKGQLEYPEGVNSDNSTWYSGFGGAYEPNSLFLPAWYYQLPNLSEIYEQSNKEAIPSLALGFVANTENIADQIGACNNVIAQYYLPLINGDVNIDEVLPVFQQALRDAGIDDIIAEKQAQLDAWLANKK